MKKKSKATGPDFRHEPQMESSPLSLFAVIAATAHQLLTLARWLDANMDAVSAYAGADARDDCLAIKELLVAACLRYEGLLKTLYIEMPRGVAHINYEGKDADEIAKEIISQPSNWSEPGADELPF